MIIQNPSHFDNEILCSIIDLDDLQRVLSFYTKKADYVNPNIYLIKDCIDKHIKKYEKQNNHSEEMQ